MMPSKPVEEDVPIWAIIVPILIAIIILVVIIVLAWKVLQQRMFISSVLIMHKKYHMGEMPGSLSILSLGDKKALRFKNYQCRSEMIKHEFL